MSCVRFSRHLASSAGTRARGRSHPRLLPCYSRELGESHVDTFTTAFHNFAIEQH